MLYAPEWAPDGKRIAFSDKDGKLFVLTLEDKKAMQVAQDPGGRLRDYVWSADGGHIAFTEANANGFRSIYVWSVADVQVHRVTSDMFETTDIAWDADGNYLYYAGTREFAPLISQTEFNFATNRGQEIYALALRKDVKSPFPPESDEVTISKEGEKPKGDEKKDEKKEEKKKEYIKIDFDGLAERVTRVPVGADNYFGLLVTKDYILYIKGGAFFYGRDAFPEASLHLYSLKDRKESLLAENMQGYALSYDGKKVLVRQERNYKLYDVKPEGKSGAKSVSTDGLMVDRVPHEEWGEMFNEVWRRYRDFFYFPNMQGSDWNGLKTQKRVGVEQVAHGADLNYVLGEMVAELSIGHAYIEGGDYEMPKRPQVALMGATLALDPTAGRYKISKIYKGQNEEELYRSPLTEVGVNAKDGDYILAIDGKELKATDNPYQFLANKANRPVQLTLNDKPAFEGARQTSYKPIANERNLIYLAWVTRNRETVSKATNGRVGYIHIPDMGAAGIREFIKYYYPQIRKEGLVVDVRGNRGGKGLRSLFLTVVPEMLGPDF